MQLIPDVSVLGWWSQVTSISTIKGLHSLVLTAIFLVPYSAAGRYIMIKVWMLLLILFMHLKTIWGGLSFGPRPNLYYVCTLTFYVYFQCVIKWHQRNIVCILVLLHNYNLRRLLLCSSFFPHEAFVKWISISTGMCKHHLWFLLGVGSEHRLYKGQNRKSGVGHCISLWFRPTQRRISRS